MEMLHFSGAAQPTTERRDHTGTGTGQSTGMGHVSALGTLPHLLPHSSEKLMHYTDSGNWTPILPFQKAIETHPSSDLKSLSFEKEFFHCIK